MSKKSCPSLYSEYTLKIGQDSLGVLYRKQGKIQYIRLDVAGGVRPEIHGSILYVQEVHSHIMNIL